MKENPPHKLRATTRITIDVSFDLEVRDGATYANVVHQAKEKARKDYGVMGTLHGDIRVVAVGER